MRLGLILGLVLMPGAAWAYSTIDTPTAPFLAGVIAPILSSAHLLALVSVGLLAAVSGGSARWAYPVSLLGATALGGFVGYIQPLADPLMVGLVLVVSMAALSVVSRSSLVGIGSAIALWGAAHGYAHGLELPALGGPLFGVGFLLANGLLLGAGLLLGSAFGSPRPMVTGTAAALTCFFGLLVIVG